MYNLSDFNLEAGHVFITKINALKEIDKISIVNADRNKNGYKVNNQSILKGTIQVNPIFIVAKS